MENFLLSCEVILPLCLLMAVGYFVRSRGMLDEHTNRVMNRVVFYVFVPALLFCNVYDSDLSAAFDPLLILYIMAGTVVNFGLLWLLYAKTIPDPRRRGAMIHGTFRGNTALFGIPIAQAILGEGHVATVAVAVAAVIPLFNVLAVTTLELCRGGKPDWKHLLRGIATNPLILSVLAGLLFALLRLRVPGVIYPALKQLGSIAAPLSFVLLGASFTFEAAAHNRRAIAAASALKLVGMPLVWYGLAVLLGWRGPGLLAVLTVFAPPTAVTSFPMAQAMESDGELAGEIVAFTSVIALVTMFLWIFVSKELGLF